MRFFFQFLLFLKTKNQKPKASVPVENIAPGVDGLQVRVQVHGVVVDVVALPELVGQGPDEAEALLALVAHQAHGARVDDARQRVQVQVAGPRRVLEVAVEVGAQLVLLLGHVAEVDEEAGAHVLLQRVHAVRGEKKRKRVQMRAEFGNRVIVIVFSITITITIT